MKSFFLPFVLLLSSLPVFGQVVTYNFAGLSGSPVTAPPTSILSGWTATDISRGTGLAADNASGAFSSKSFTTAATPDANDYLEFTVTAPGSGGPHSISGVKFTFDRSVQGPKNYQIKTSVNGAAETTVLGGSVAAPPSSTIFTIPPQTGLANNATYRVRLYAFNAGNTSGVFQLLTTLEVLPTTLVSWSGQHDAGRSVLQFTTASELNNARFEVERSANGRDFGAIGYVAGAGTTNQLQRYEWVDEKPLSGINYYRLRQVDYDGRFVYSNVIAVRNQSKSGISVVPTVVTDDVQINVDADISDELGVWQVLDLLGRVVISGPLDMEQSTVNTDLSSLQSGGYIVCLRFGGEVLTQRITKI
jgi:hypothetical protein